MISIRVEHELPPSAVDFLKHCYRFVNEEWPHADRDDSPDDGFEQTFRENCIRRLSGWEVSQAREMRMGHELDTASGVLHEIDIVAKHADVTAILELKNRQGPPAKNDVIVLFAKLLDYLARNPTLLLKELCPIFMSTSPFEHTGLEACLGLGIHPVGPGLRPIPILTDTARRIRVEIDKGVDLSEAALNRFEEFCAELNTISFNVSENWASSRFGYRSENTIIVKVSIGSDTYNTSAFLRHLNSECNWLLSSIRETKQ